MKHKQDLWSADIYTDMLPAALMTVLFYFWIFAFDTIEHTFMFQALQKFGFGKYFCSATETL